MGIIPPTQLQGHRIQSVVAAWLERDGHRIESPIHVWLALDSLGSIRLHTAGDGSLELSPGDPYANYEMDELGSRVVVEEASAESLLGRLLGSEIRVVNELRSDRHAEMLGLLLDSEVGSIGIANIGDDLIVLPWPSPEWDTWSISAVHP
jgi:hypothetical protein